MLDVVPPRMEGLDQDVIAALALTGVDIISCGHWDGGGMEGFTRRAVRAHRPTQ